MTERIAYDFDSLATRRPPDSAAEVTLRHRKAVCGGYAKLFEKLGKCAGLEVIEIRGLAKNGMGVGSAHERHAWNAVRLAGQWRLVDCAFGAARITGNTNKKKSYDEYYFLVPPESLILTHLPDDPQWQLLGSPVNREEFLTWPAPPPHLLRYGFSAADVLAKLKLGPLVVCHAIPDIKVTVRAAPLEGKLQSGQKYRFCIESAGFEDMWVFMDGSRVPLKRTGVVFEGTVQGRKGQLQLGAHAPHESNRCQVIFAYTVE